MDQMTSNEIDRVFALQRDHRWKAKVSSVEHRRAMLTRLRQAVLDHEDAAVKALHADLGKPSGDTHARAEILNTVNHIDEALDRIDEWLTPREPQGSLDYAGSTVQLRYEARGVVLVFGPWNFPLQLALQPLFPPSLQATPRSSSRVRHARKRRR